MKLLEEKAAPWASQSWCAATFAVVGLSQVERLRCEHNNPHRRGLLQHPRPAPALAAYCKAVRSCAPRCEQ